MFSTATTSEKWVVTAILSLIHNVGAPGPVQDFGREQLAAALTEVAEEIRERCADAGVACGAESVGDFADIIRALPVRVEAGE